MLIVKDIYAGYGKLQILNGMSLHVKLNSLTAILGGNGCGKSTTLKAITGLLKVIKGNIIFKGKSILGTKPQDIVKLGIAYVTQGKDVFPSMTVFENLQLGAYTIKNRQQIRQNLEEVLEIFPRLKERIKSPSGVLSGGEQQMLSIGRGLMSNPSLLILDEPSAALSPKISDEIYKLISLIHNQGITILLVEQNVKKALEISEYTYILSEGHVVFKDISENLRKHEDIKSFYLGNFKNDIKEAAI
jgi:branched-chain amino acid transport system ATP-binding protein